MNPKHDTREYEISTEKSRLDIPLIHEFLSNKSYWAKGITMPQLERAICHSLCYGIYHARGQVGFGRVVTDFTTTAYVGDVFIVESHRGKGLSVWLMDTIVAHPDMQGLRRWVLATADAHALYRKSGFGPLARPERWMEKHRPGAYD